MKRILLMRHATAEGLKAGVDDHERPLSARGREEAREVGEALRADSPQLSGQGLGVLLPDIALCSPARRTRETFDALCEASGATPEAHSPRALYYATPEIWLAHIQDQPTTCETLLVVGHEPSMSGLVFLLSGQTQTMRPATLVVLTAPVDEWNAVKAGACELRAVVRPS